MNVDKIKILLERYYDGQTSEMEEKELKRFFLEEKHVPDSLKEDKEFFIGLLQVAEPKELPFGWEERLDGLIDEWDVCEQKKTDRALKNARIIRLKWISGVAACVLLLVSTNLSMRLFSEPMVLCDTYTTPEEAYEETEKALKMFSVNLNKGLAQMKVMHDATEKIQDYVNKQLNNLNTSEK